MEHLYQRRVQFADTDAAGVVHFARLLCYVEEAEHDLLKSLNIPLLDDGGWPRVHVACDYTAPAKFGELLTVAISPKRLGGSSILWSFSVACDDKIVAQGEMKAVRVDPAGNTRSLEDSWRDALGA
jgi:acyl-CoA thioester hydrolase